MFRDCQPGHGCIIPNRSAVYWSTVKPRVCSLAYKTALTLPPFCDLVTTLFTHLDRSMKAEILYFYFNVHTRRKVQAHQHVDGLGVWIQDINQAVMCADFKMLV